MKWLPLIVTGVPPPVLPVPVPSEVTDGAPALVYVNWSPLPSEAQPALVMTITSTIPAAWAGEVAVIEVAEFTVKLAAASLPKLTAKAPGKLVPVMATLVPPAVVPVLVPRLVTAGAVARV